MTIEILENLKKAIIECDDKAAATWAQKAIEEQVNPLEAVDALISGIRHIGDGFGRGEYFLPELVSAAKAMQAAMPKLEEELKNREMCRKSLGTIVIGTVFGDVHTIGKSIVATVLIAEGFSVYDLGINITAEEFIKAIKGYKADILAMSALLTITAPEQAKVISALKNAGLRDKVKVMVGGGAITDEFAQNIGADGYESTAPGAAKLARKLLGIK